MFINFSVILSLTWFAYFIVFLITLYKMFEFFGEMEKKKVLGNSQNVKELQNLYIASFSLQIIALVISVIFVVGLSFYYQKIQQGIDYIGGVVEKIKPKQQTQKSVKGY